MGKTDIQKFWELLNDSKFTGQPSKVTEDEIRWMATKLGWHEQDIEAAIQGLRDYLEER
jgi:hypothetical protein